MIRSRLMDIFSEIFGNYSARYEYEINLLSKLCYYVPTMIFPSSGNNCLTLGEEYCSIVPIINQNSSSGNNTRLLRPGWLRRVLLLFSSVMIPYIINKIRKHGRTRFIHSNLSQFQKYLYKVWNQIIAVIMKSDTILKYFFKFHLCLFYFQSQFYQIANRFLNIGYIYVGNATLNKNLRFMDYRGLGRLILIEFALILVFIITKFIVSMIKYAYFRYKHKNKTYEKSENDEIEAPSDIKLSDIVKNEFTMKSFLEKSNLNILFGDNNSEKKTDSNETSDFDERKDESGARIVSVRAKPKEISNSHDWKRMQTLHLKFVDSIEISDDIKMEAPQCILCLSPRRYPTVTECGHIYCWHCIAEWCHSKPECPFCRSHISVQKLIRLVNVV